MKQYIAVTGGTKGIGRAIVMRFAREGFGIITCARSKDDLQKLKQEVEEQVQQAEIHIEPADLSQRQGVQQFAEFCRQVTERVQVLVNNTGIFLSGQLHNEEEGVLEQQISTNLYSAYHLTRALLPPMMAAMQGHIFTLCSTASITPYTNGGSYCISKYALYGMTKVLREELKPHNIRVTALLPGATLTASWEGTDLPEERFMKPEDVAEIVWCAYSLSKLSVVEEVLMRPQLGDLN